jgi:type I restriction enzyme S subunit
MKWEKVKLGDIATCIQPGPFGSQLHNSDYSKEGTPIIMPKDIVGGAIVHSGLLKVSEEHVKRLSRHQVYEGNLMVARKGDVRKCAYITANENGWMTGSDCLKVVLDESKCYPKFIYYQLRSEHIGRWLEKVSIGATMPSLNTGLLSGIEMVLPPIEIQKQIAGILSAYDDLIENNQKQIKLLEEAAQRLYKEWFVDLHFPGHENTKIVDGVPEGWRRGLLKELISVNYGKDHKKVPDDGNIPVYGSGGLMRKCNKSLFSGEAVLIPRKGSLNNIMYVDETFWTVDTMFYATMKQPHTAVFVYFFVKAFDMYSMNIGAAVPSMTTKILDAMDVVIPDKETLEKFDKYAKVYFNKIKTLQGQNEQLKTARDLLLPKLMSGEVEV